MIRHFLLVSTSRSVLSGIAQVQGEREGHGGPHVGTVSHAG